MKQTKSPEEQMDEFDPNATNALAFATFCLYRNPQFKIHRNRGPALNAILLHLPYGILYKFQNGRWEEVIRVTKEINHCQHGGSPNKWSGRIGHYYVKWIRLNTDYPELIAVCSDCYHKK